MRKFLELARMTLMEDIVAIEDIETTFEFSDRGKDKHDAPLSHSTSATQERSSRNPMNSTIPVSTLQIAVLRKLVAIPPPYNYPQP